MSFSKSLLVAAVLATVSNFALAKGEFYKLNLVNPFDL